jgi:hypothetical protein
MAETKEVEAKDLQPGQKVMEARQLGSELVEFEREVYRVHGPDDDGLMLIEYREPSYEGEASCYPADAEIDVVV